MAARLDLISDKMTDLLPNRPRTCGESLKEARGHARISLYYETAGGETSRAVSEPRGWFPVWDIS
jgi:hypothetical protein